MSYCRWSSMNWRCDVYTYEDVSGGWTTHVAGRRRIFPPVPDLPLMRFRFGAEWDDTQRASKYPTKWHKRAAGVWFRLWGFWHRWIHGVTLDLIPLRRIGLPHDGGSFNDSTPGECADTLERLRAIGYIVPQYAIDSLREEEAENKDA
jgi:hypothetical protein